MLFSSKVIKGMKFKSRVAILILESVGLINTTYKTSHSFNYTVV